MLFAENDRILTDIGFCLRLWYNTYTYLFCEVAMKKLVIGILAHVDAGKTTLAEAILYHTGRLKKPGRVDHGDTVMDTHSIERERGITIFSSQAVFTYGDMEVTLLDTPGHVDFSAETERALQVLDYAVMVISGIDGVQAHTRTLWRLLKLYNVPTFIFVTKMDLARHSRHELMEGLRSEFGGSCIDFSADSVERRNEELSMCREDVLDSYLETGIVTDSAAAELIRSRLAYPCYFGSGLKLDGVDEFLNELDRYTIPGTYSDSFGAKVFKISHDAQGNRLTHLKVTGGKLRVRDIVSYDGKEEKVNQIRIYSGAKFETTDTVSAGGVCAVMGLSSTQNGQGLGREAGAAAPVLEPVMNFRVSLPEGCDAQIMLQKLKLLEEEDPQLNVTWNSHQKEIHVGLMGVVQTEVLKSIILDRFGVEVEIDRGRVLYKETIENTVEGVGHYEPLRHYAEVHLILEPLPRGSGIVLATRCSEDKLDRNWQRLIMTHLLEKQHLGVLTGSPITDMKITLAAGKAHVKHTEGGDFRQATYRAVRQGLMQARSILLEPYYSFRLEVPPEQIGRAISDIRARFGEFETPEENGSMTLLRGTAPVASMNDYGMEVAAYTRGVGRLAYEVSGYGLCHNADQVIADFAYQPESDLENTPDSVFCEHGGGFTVKWDEVPGKMHLESCLKEKKEEAPRRNLQISEKELQAIIAKVLGPEKRQLYRPAVSPKTADPTAHILENQQTKTMIIDGYNVIFAWDDLNDLAQTDLDGARTRLMSVLSNYAAYTKRDITLVFDAYKVPGNVGHEFKYNNINVVYTKEHETADVYIEKLIAAMGRNSRARVVTSDGLIQLSAVRSGIFRMSAAEFEREVNGIDSEIGHMIRHLSRDKGSTVGENVKIIKGE